MKIIMTRIIVITWHLPVSPCYPPWQQQRHRGASPFSHWKKNISQKVGTLQPPVQRNWSWCDFSQVIKSNIFNIFFILRDATVITHFTIARITCSSIACFSLSRVITWQPTKFVWIIIPTSDLNYLIVKCVFCCFTKSPPGGWVHRSTPEENFCKFMILNYCDDDDDDDGDDGDFDDWQRGITSGIT